MISSCRFDISLFLCLGGLGESFNVIEVSAIGFRR
jgi:hypothetical protein